MGGGRADTGATGRRPTVEELFGGDDPTSAAHRARDWAATSLGPVESWPPELYAAVRTVLPSTIPMLLWWGPELVQLFNDAYTPLLGDKYPAGIGQPAAQCWPDVWDAMGPLADAVLAGRGAAHGENTRLFTDRRGYQEETFWTFSYSPVHGADGQVLGVFVATSDTTGQVVGDRRLSLLRELGELSVAGADTTDAARLVARVLGGGPADLPVGRIWLVDTDADAPAFGTEPRPVASFGPLPAAPYAGDLPVVREVLRTGRPGRIAGPLGTAPDIGAPGGSAPVGQAVALPLVATGHSRPVGVLVAGVSPHLAFDDPYQHFLDLVAGRMSTALTDVLTYEAQRRRARALADAAGRQAALATLTARLAGATDLAEVLHAGLDELRDLLGGARGVAVCAGTAGIPLVVDAGLPLTGPLRHRLDRLGADGEPELTHDAAGGVTGLGARLEPGDPPGGFWLELSPPRPPSAIDRPLVRQLCGALAQALVRARAFETQRTVALAMQRAMLGPVDLPAGFAVRYQPAVRPLEVGGDWYDVVPLAGDLVGLVVGDVVGRGLPAATVMGQLRSASRALLLQAKSPAEVLSALDDFARLVPGGVCTTVFCAILDRALGVVRYSSAGHPPAILAHPDGSTQLLHGAGSVPLASVAVRGRPEAGVQLHPGSTLLLYTDGLVERRRELIDAGIDRAVGVLTESRELPEGVLADRLVRDLLPDGRDDDVAVLVYRHREPAVFAAALTADPVQLAPTREALRRWLAGLGIADPDADAVLIAAGEACANAIEHGCRFAPGATVTVRGRLRADRLEVLVSDTGGWREAGDPADTDRGRGRFIMARLMDEATVDGTAEGTTVRLVKRVTGTG
ncbi:SpoIIE family protein phosphatase [Agromyces sp. NPDC049794]|uniref:SpoIIE family protein phosphatase n=1 Tax=Agromyces sp. NPDC049794 TaxID=3154362 RepID=UPI0033F77C41